MFELLEGGELFNFDGFDDKKVVFNIPETQAKGGNIFILGEEGEDEFIGFLRKEIGNFFGLGSGVFPIIVFVG